MGNYGPCGGVKRQPVSFQPAAFARKKRHTARGVAAHFGLASVAVKNAHLHAVLPAAQKHQPVGTNAEAAVAYGTRGGGKIGYGFLLGIDKHKVVAQALIFIKMHMFIV